MKTRLFTGFLVLTFVTTTAFAQKARHTTTAESTTLAPFVGTWKLVSSTMTMPDGTVKSYGFGPHATGMLMYDGGGHVCVQVVNPDRPAWANPDHPSPEEVKTAFDGFGGYCGTFTVDAEKHILAHIPEIAFDPNIGGKASPRSYSFNGDRLIYEGTDSSEGVEAHWTMVWERVK